MTMKKMITNLRSFDCFMNSPCQYQRKCIGKGRENIDTDIGVWRVHSYSFVFFCSNMSEELKAIFRVLQTISLRTRR